MAPILIICPNFPPQLDGLSGYTSHFADHLHHHRPVEVLTSKSNTTQEQFTVHRIIENWNWSGLRKLCSFSSTSSANRILIQYLPFLYQRRGGINFAIVALAWWIRLRTNKKLEIMFHELYFPFSWKPKAIIMHLAHKMMLWGLALAAHNLFASCESYTRILKETFPYKKKNIFLLPVGSNISVARASSDTKERAPLTKLCTFGGLHPSKKIKLLLKTLSKIYRKNSLFELTMIGPTKPELENYWQGSLDELPFVRLTGPLDEAAVSLEFQHQDCYVGLFNDGASLRRGSLIAPLQHGLPVLSTLSDTTEEILRHHPQLHLIAMSSSWKNLLQKNLQQWINHPPAKLSLEQAQDFLSWNKIVEDYLLAHKKQ